LLTAFIHSSRFGHFNSLTKAHLSFDKIHDTHVIAVHT